MDARSRPIRVCVVTSAGLVPGRSHRDVALAAIDGGADAVQLRAPELADEELLPLASELAEACRATGVLFVVNDRIDVAVASGAHAAHVGKGDEPVRARERLGPDRVLGISVGTPEEARAAERVGADYLGVTVWATATKPEARPVGLDGLRSIVEATTLSILGIGGIDARNAPDVVAAGATGVAVVSAVGAADDPVAATRELVLAVGADDASARRR
jgi:thiamine-phosphate pyrophosphorylase